MREHLERQVVDWKIHNLKIVLEIELGLFWIREELSDNTAKLVLKSSI
jgi:hypothetical protein